MTEKTCSNCKHHSIYKRPKILEATGFGDQMMFDDSDEAVIICRAPAGPRASQEIGLTPISCTAHEPAAAALSEEKRKELDEWEKRFAERAAKRGDRE